jgi:hypothetical protein
MMRGALIVLFVSRTAFAADAPGTIKPLSDAPPLVDAASGETFSQISPSEAVSFALTGPRKFQVDFRVNIKRKGAPRPVNLEIFAGGSLLTQLRINARPSHTAAWRAVNEFKPSESAEFFLTLEAGSQVVVFHIDEGATLGAAVNIVDANHAKRAFARDAPVLSVPVEAAPTVGTTVAPTAAPTPPPPPKTEPAKIEATAAPHIAAKPEPAHEPIAKPVEVREQEAPPPELPARRLSLVVGGGIAAQSELGAFDSQSAAQVVAGLALQLPLHLFASLDYELRYGTIVVPLVGAAAETTHEIRHELGVAFGWAPVLIQRGDVTLSLPFSASYQLLVFSNAVAPAVAGLLGPDAGLRLNRGWLTADASVGYGFRIHDSTSPADANGGIDGRLRWQAEALGQVSPLLAVFVSYQGESLVRAQSTRIANAMLAGVVLSLF